MTRVAIVTDAGGWHVRELQRALRERGATGRSVDLADCRVDTLQGRHGIVLPGFGGALPDAALVRGIAGGSFEQVTLRLGVLHALAALGVPVYNEARAIERSVDKAMTSLLLHAAGLPAPTTWAMESLAVAQRLVTRESAAGRSLVVKPLFGSQGKGIERVGWVEGRHVGLPAAGAAGDLAGAPYGGVAYLQRFVEPLARPGHDWRVLVVGGRAVAAMRRVSEHWVHNVARGARCVPEPLDHGAGPTLARLAEAAARALEMDYAGVDLIPTPDGPQILEVNGVAAWRGLQRVTSIDLARAIVDDLLDGKCARLARQQLA
ncbi:MAG TPA: RimK family alpha-L-glutamate ligase [Burkholderiaceae bacterium]|jgi:RimK family alpha-L-glutamate ligase|nr:RimK family alpha-L-glutamate ligase [Burkholderiaceae bacterium]